MSSPIINVFFNNRVDLENSLGERVLYISLQGRLGNQLFGLSDAYSLHKKFDLKIMSKFMSSFGMNRLTTCDHLIGRLRFSLSQPSA